jgi:hypothetical protein
MVHRNIENTFNIFAFQRIPHRYTIIFITHHPSKMSQQASESAQYQAKALTAETKT